MYEDADNHYIVMEYLPAGTLLHFLAQLPDRFVYENEAKKIISQLAQALSVLHARNIVHQDIKLENVLIDSQTGNCKLADFGAAMQLTSLEAKGCDRDSPVMGTRGYFAPELLYD